VKRSAFFLLLLLAFLAGKAQQLSFFKPDNLRSLPSSECYNILQDHLGYIWFSTEAGLCRFNGKSVKVFNKNSGIPENATYTIKEDKKGKLWVTTSSNRMLFHDARRDSFLEAPFSKECSTFFTKRRQEIYRQDFSADSLLYLSSPYFTLKINTLTNKVALADTNKPGQMFFLLEPDAAIPVKFHLSYSTMERVAKKKALDAGIQRGSTTFLIPVQIQAKYYVPGSRSLGILNNRGEYYVAFDNSLIKINPDLTWKVLTLDASILDIYCDKDGGVWIGTYKNGVYYYPDGFQTVIHSLPDLSVSGICEDAERGIWCTTLEKGVMYSRSKYVINYSNIQGLDKRPEFLKVIGKILFTSSDRNELFELRSPTVVAPPIALPTSAGVTDIINYKNKWLIGCKGPLVQTDTNFKHGKIVTFPESAIFSHTIKRFTTLGNRVFALHRNSLLELQNDHLYRRHSALPSAGNCVLGCSSGLLLGCKDGLYLVDTANFQLSKVPGINGSVTQLYESKDGSAWIVVREQGVFALRGKDIKKLPELPGLAAARYSCVTDDATGTFWIASNLGLVKLKDPFGKSKVQVFTSLHGLNSTEELLVSVAGERVYVASYDGLCSFPLSIDLANEAAPHIYIKEVLVNGKKRDLSKHVVLASKENSLIISLNIPIYKQGAQPMRFHYKIEGTTQDRIQEGSELSLTNLAPGQYKISFFALNSDNRPSLQPAVLTFTIDKPFWQKPLFLIGILLILISLTYFIVNAIIRRVRKKEEEKTRVNKLLAEYQMSALRAQMNPHFIFNCINSIQKFILSNNAEQAYDYLSKFSKLIRLVLNYAEDNLISLQQELEIVNLYLELEQLRFDEKFTYEINIGDEVDVAEAMVPVMLLQPYIENAIWHGLMHLEEAKKGHIFMNISMADNLLTITIEDNGVGLERSAALRKKEHKSKATEINNRRSRIMNILESQTSGGIVIENIVGSKGDIEGTRVILKVPQNAYEDE
jgi:streptogramin lyase